MQPIRIAIVAAAFVTLACAPAAAQREDTFRWSGQLAAGKTIEVSGINGDVQARPSSGRTVEVVAVKRGDDDDPTAVDIEVVERAEGSRSAPVYPGKRGSRNSTCGHWGRRPRRLGGQRRGGRLHDFGSLGCRLRRFDGQRRDRRLGALIGRQREHGERRDRGGVDRDGRSENGQRLDRRFDGGRELERHHRVPDRKRLDPPVAPGRGGGGRSAQTLNGDFSSDFPLTVEAGEWGPKQVSGSIGSGGGRLDLETVNGEIEIRKS